MFLLVLTIALSIKYYFHRKWSVLKSWKIPHDPPSFRNLGNLRTVLSDTNFFSKCKKKYGPIYGYYTVAYPRIVIHDLDLLQEIFIKQFSHFPNRIVNLRFLQGKYLANGLLFALHEDWKRMRRTIAPSFSCSKLKEMFKIVNWCVDNTVNSFIKISEKDEGIFFCKNVFSKLSLDVISSCAFSADVNSQDTSKVEPQISIQAKKYVDVGFFRILFQLGVLFPFLEKFIAKILDNRRHATFFRNLVNKLITSKNVNINEVARVDLMQLMLDAKASHITDGETKGMLFEEIVGNSITMFLAGYETTSTAMSFLAYNLAQNPDIQLKLQKEIDEMYKSTKSLEYDDVKELKYLDMCVKESIRLYCPVGVTKRFAQKSIVTKCGRIIPKGVDIYMPIYALCHDPDHWVDPMKFFPERMGDVDKVNPMKFSPFGSGPRNCVGMKFAFMEIKIAFCKLLNKFTFETTSETPKHPINLQYTLSANFTDFKLKAVPRKYA